MDDSTTRNPQKSDMKKPTAEERQKKQKQQRVLLILIILIVVGAVMILYRNGVIGGSASKAPVEQYLQAIAAKDFDAYIGAMPPKIAESYVDDREDIGLSGEEYMYQLYSDYFIEFGDDMTVTLEFTDRSRLETVYIDNFKESYLRAYGEEINIRSSFEIDVIAHFSGSKSSDDINLECFVVKVGGKWYIAGCDYQTVEANE